MAKLSEILGGITKDITQAQITSDLVSLDYLQQYQEHPLLKKLDVPRVKIRDIQVNLKFAIDEAQSQNISDNAKTKVASLWKSQVDARLIPQVISSLVSDANSQKALTNVMLQSTKTSRQPIFKADEILGGESSKVSKTTEDYVIDLVKKLPTSLRKTLPNLTDIRRQVNAVANENLTANVSKLNKVAMAQSVEDFDLNIIIEQEALQTTPVEQIHEISVAIDIDDHPIETD